MKKPVLFAIFVLIAASLACNLANQATGSAGDATAQPASKVLFKDDFADTGSGWNQVRDSDGVTDYENGAYHILINTIGQSGNGMSYWARPGLASQLPADVKIEVDATKNSGPDDNDFGVLCRYVKTNDVASFYQFMVTSDGYVGITLIDGDNQTIISDPSEKLQPSDLVKKGEASNHVRADCIGDTFTLYVNGTKAASATNSKLPAAGDVGVIAGTYSAPGTDIFFDNFIVSKP